VTWTSRTVPAQITSSFAYASFTNNTFIGIDYSANLASSTDGITWTYRSSVAGAKAYQIAYLASTGFYYGNGYVSTDLITWVLAPVKAGSTVYVNGYNVSDGTRVVNETASYNPTPYTTATQFIVPDYGGIALGPSPVYGGYYNIKT
jgi:hypothetical protein